MNTPPGVPTAQWAGPRPSSTARPAPGPAAADLAAAEFSGKDLACEEEAAPDLAGADLPTGDTPVAAVREHLQQLTPALESLQRHAVQLAAWGAELAARLTIGHRLLAAGNGGSAAEAQHLTAELVGRYQQDRRAFSALALHADTSTLTAVGNDYGYDQVFARQVTGHARAGDVVLLLSTSGSSSNLLRAAEAARAAGATSWALTGSGPNPLSRVVDECIAIDALAPSVQEAHLIAVHALCCCFDAEVARLDAAAKWKATE